MPETFMNEGKAPVITVDVLSSAVPLRPIS